MGKLTLTVYQFEYFDRSAGELVRSKDWATAKAIAEVGATRLEGTAREVDARLVHINGIAMSKLD